MGQAAAAAAAAGDGQISTVDGKQGNSDDSVMPLY